MALIADFGYRVYDASIEAGSTIYQGVKFHQSALNFSRGVSSFTQAVTDAPKLLSPFLFSLPINFALYTPNFAISAGKSLSNFAFTLKSPVNAFKDTLNFFEIFECATKFLTCDKDSWQKMAALLGRTAQKSDEVFLQLDKWKFFDGSAVCANIGRWTGFTSFKSTYPLQLFKDFCVIASSFFGSWNSRNEHIEITPKLNAKKARLTQLKNLDIQNQADMQAFIPANRRPQGLKADLATVQNRYTALCQNYAVQRQTIGPDLALQDRMINILNAQIGQLTDNITELENLRARKSGVTGYVQKIVINSKLRGLTKQRNERTAQVQNLHNGPVQLTPQQIAKLDLWAEKTMADKASEVDRLRYKLFRKTLWENLGQGQPLPQPGAHQPPLVQEALSRINMIAHAMGTPRACLAALLARKIEKCEADVHNMGIKSRRFFRSKWFDIAKISIVVSGNLSALADTHLARWATGLHLFLWANLITIGTLGFWRTKFMAFDLDNEIKFPNRYIFPV